MKPGRAARLAASIAIGLYTLGLLVTDVKVGGGLKPLVSFTPTLVVGIFLVLDRWAWRWPRVHRLTGHPWLGGTWRLTLTPSADSHIPAHGNCGPIDAFLVVEQTWWGIYLTQVTRESRSTSVGASFRTEDGTGQHRLLFTYINVPRQQHQPRSPQHDGACTLTSHGRLPLELDGSYFTSRLTRGDIQASLLDRKTDLISYDSLATRHEV